MSEGSDDTRVHHGDADIYLHWWVPGNALPLPERFDAARYVHLLIVAYRPVMPPLRRGRPWCTRSMEPSPPLNRLLVVKVLSCVALIVASHTLTGCGSDTGLDASAAPTSGETVVAVSNEQARDLETAVAASREHLRAGDTLSAATMTRGNVAVESSNTGETCSGPTLSVRLFGVFPSVPVAGTPGENREVSEVDLVVDASTGKTCLVSVSVGGAKPDAAATQIPVEDIT